MAPTTINLDHNATTPIAPEAVEAMAVVAGEFPGNPASQHQLGRAARRRLEEIRERLGVLLGARLGNRSADDDKIIFTSGATEANNLAIRGLAGPAPARILVSAIEHPSVLQTAEQLATQGYDVAKIPVDASGIVRLDALSQQLQQPTRLVSVMFGNHETGVRQPIPAIAELCQSAGAMVHVDAVQAVGKVPFRFAELGATAITLSAHKFHGPRGIGALVLEGGTSLAPLMFGGPQQHAQRPGTESLALPAGLLAALELAADDADAEQRMARLRDDFENRLLAEAPEIAVLGPAVSGMALPRMAVERLPHTSCLTFPPLDRQAFFVALDLAGVICSTGSACESGSSEPSPVLREMACSEAAIGSALRFSLGRKTTAGEIAEGASRILAIYKDLRGRNAGSKTAVPATREA